MPKLKLVLVVLTVAAISSAAGFWLNQHPPGVTIINPARLPEPILELAEVEKIHTLQNTREVFLLGGMSPDDTSLLVVAGTSEESGQASWLDIGTGQFKPIDSKLLELFP